MDVYFIKFIYLKLIYKIPDFVIRTNVKKVKIRISFFY